MPKKMFFLTSIISLSMLSTTIEALPTTTHCLQNISGICHVNPNNNMSDCTLLSEPPKYFDVVIKAPNGFDGSVHFTFTNTQFINSNEMVCNYKSNSSAQVNVSNKDLAQQFLPDMNDASSAWHVTKHSATCGSTSQPALANNCKFIVVA